MLGQLRQLSRLHLVGVVPLKSGLKTEAQSQVQYCCQKKRESTLFASGNTWHRRPGRSNSRTRSDATSFPTKAPVVSSSPFLFPYFLVGPLISPSWKLGLVPSLTQLDILSQKNGAYRSFPWGTDLQTFSFGGFPPRVHTTSIYISA